METQFLSCSIFLDRHCRVRCADLWYWEKIYLPGKSQRWVNCDNGCFLSCRKLDIYDELGMMHLVQNSFKIFAEQSAECCTAKNKELRSATCWDCVFILLWAFPSSSGRVTIKKSLNAYCHHEVPMYGHYDGFYVSMKCRYTLFLMRTPFLWPSLDVLIFQGI